MPPKQSRARSDATHLSRYTGWLKRQPLSDQTRRAYGSRAKKFLEHLEELGENLDALLDNDREFVHILKEYKRYLKRSEKAKPTTVNAHLTAVDHLVQFLGRAPYKVAREDLPQESPRALSKNDQKRFLRSVSACRRSKDRAVASLLFYTGIRIGECASLDISDVRIAGRNKLVIVRSGKGDRYREIPLHQDAVESVREWMLDRATKFDGIAADEALFLNPQGRRMSTTAIDAIVRKIGDGCGLSLSAHVLRHSCLTNLVRNGNDLILVAEVGGHKRLETTRRYTLPSTGDKEKAIAELLGSES